MDGEDRALLKSLLPAVFGPLPDALLDRTADGFEVVSLRSGEVLYRRGDPGEGLHVVLSGRLAVSVVEGRTVRHLTRGDCVGEIAMMTGARRTATVTAIRNVVLAHLSRERFDRLVSAHPQAGLGLARRALTQLTESEGAPPARAEEVRTIALVPLDGRVPVERLASRLQIALLQFGSTARLDARTVALRLSGVASPARQAAGGALDRLLEDTEGARRFVLYEADPEPTDWTRRCLAQADRVLLVAWAGASPEPRPLERELAAERWAATDLVLLHAGREAPSGTAAWLGPRRVERHFHVAWDGHRGIGRLARFLGGRAVSLVLGGGGACGFAQIGAVRAIREAGIPIDAAGGTSIGALIAAGVALDWQDEQMLQTFRRAFVDERPLNDFTLPLFAMLAGEKASRGLRRWYGDVDIADLWAPYFCVTSNLTRSCASVHRGGALWKALRASVALPGILPPFVMDKELHVDGGILDNLPVSVMQTAIGGRTIAVDASVRAEAPVGRDSFPTPLEHLAARYLAGKGDGGFPTLASLLIKTSTLGGSSAISASRGHADLYLCPPTQGFDFLDWGRIYELAELGYRYTRERLPAWIAEHPQVVRHDEALEFRARRA